MKKTFTLMLLVLATLGAKAENEIIAVLIGETALDWSDAVKLPIGTLTGIAENDYLYFLMDESSVKLQYWDGSQNQAIEGATSPYKVSNTMATALQSNDLRIQQNNKIWFVGYGPALSYGTASDNIITSDIVGESFYTWSEDIKNNIKLFDKIQFTIAPNNTGTGKFAIKHGDGSWETYYPDTDVSGEQTIEWSITSLQALRYIKSDKIWFGDPSESPNKNLKITSIKYIPCNNKIIVRLQSSIKSYVKLDETPANATIQLNRSFKQYWNTLCLPFDASVSSIAADARAYTFSGASNDKISLTQVAGGIMTAGTPYMVYLENAVTAPITFENVTVTANTPGTSSTFNGLTFTGNYTAGQTFSGYGLIDNTFKAPNGGSAKLKAFSAYLAGSYSAGAPSFNIVTDDNTTGITDIITNNPENNDTYNLQGMRLGKAKKGIYVKNGKKVIIK